MIRRDMLHEAKMRVLVVSFPKGKENRVEYAAHQETDPQQNEYLGALFPRFHNAILLIWTTRGERKRRLCDSHNAQSRDREGAAGCIPNFDFLHSLLSGAGGIPD